jgi:hypothetical protein
MFGKYGLYSVLLAMEEEIGIVIGILTGIGIGMF